MPDDAAFDIEGYDGAVDDGPSFGGPRGNARAGMPSPGRRGGKKALAPPSAARYGRRGRPGGGRGFARGFGINPRELARSVNSLLAAAVVGVLAVALILLYTFSTFKAGDEMQFYGALAAAMAVVLALSYLAVRLLNIAD